MFDLATIICGLLWLAFLATTLIGFRYLRFIQADRVSADTTPTAAKRLKLKAAVILVSCVAGATVICWFLLPANLLPAIRLSLVPAVLLVGYLFAAVVWYRQYRALADPVTALARVSEEIERTGRTKEAVYWLGLTLINAGRWSEAVAAFEEARELGCDEPEAVYSHAMALWKSGQAEQAVPLFREAETALPEPIIVPISLCELFLELGRRGEAVRELQKAEELQSKTSPETLRVAKPGLERCRLALNVAR